MGTLADVESREWIVDIGSQPLPSLIKRKLWIAAAESSEIYLKSLNEHDQYCNFVLITSVYHLPSSSYFSVSNPMCLGFRIHSRLMIQAIIRQ